MCNYCVHSFCTHKAQFRLKWEVALGDIYSTKTPNMTHLIENKVAVETKEEESIRGISPSWVNFVATSYIIDYRHLKKTAHKASSLVVAPLKKHTLGLFLLCLNP